MTGSDFPSFSFATSIREELQISRNSACPSNEGLDFDAITEELKTHSAKIREAHEVVKKSHSLLEKQVLEVRDIVKKKEQELKLLNSWPIQIADDAKKWMDLWESRFGKRILNSQNSKLAENATRVETIAHTVNYCRQFIYAKRNAHEEWRKSSQTMRSFYESEIKRVQREISWLKGEVANWELHATKNELCVVELGTRLKQLQLELLEKRSQLEDTKDNRDKITH